MTNLLTHMRVIKHFFYFILLSFYFSCSIPEKTHLTNIVLEKLNNIPFVTVAHITTGSFNIFCKVRSRNTNHAKEIIFMIDDIEGVSRTETMISLEESINDKKRLMHKIFNEIK